MMEGILFGMVFAITGVGFFIASMQQTVKRLVEELKELRYVLKHYLEEGKRNGNRSG